MLRPGRGGEPTLYIPTAFLASTLAVALSRQATAQQHSSFVLLNGHPALRTAAGWLFENYAHIRFSTPGHQDQASVLAYRAKKSSPPIDIPTPTRMISDSTALGTIQAPFDFYWRPRENNFPGIDALIRVGDTVWALQFTLSSTHRSAKEGLVKVRSVMNHISKVKWRLVIVGSDQESAEACRDQQNLGGDWKWKNTIIYACSLPLGKFTDANLQELQGAWIEPGVSTALTNIYIYKATWKNYDFVWRLNGGYTFETGPSFSSL